jgi:two-component system chemotaxis response regulator CheB
MSNGFSGVPQEVVRVMVVDDSIIVRKSLAVIISREPDLEVVASARNGAECLDLVKRNRPDIVLLDVMMPGMSGLETLTELRKLEPDLPVIMFSSVTQEGAAVTVEALSKGANDYVAKPTGTISTTDTIETIRRDLLPKIRIQMEASRVRGTFSRAAPQALARRGRATPQILAIGVSTGGPAALDTLLAQLPADFPLPIVIVQHMPATFTPVLAARLDARCALQVVEAKAEMAVQPGRVIIAKGDRHLALAPRSEGVVVGLHDGPPVNSCRPSVDVLLDSVATIYGPQSIAVILTGMGNDGLRGCERLYRLGARIIVQDAATSVVWGMPGNVFRAGFAHRVAPLEKIVSEIGSLIELGSG